MSSNGYAIHHQQNVAKVLTTRSLEEVQHVSLQCLLYKILKKKKQEISESGRTDLLIKNVFPLTIPGCVERHWLSTGIWVLPCKENKVVTYRP